MRRFSALLFLAVAALPVGACDPKTQGEPRVIVIGGEPQLRDPALGPLSPPQAVLTQSVAQGLVRFDAAGNVVAGLAERWNVSDDGMSYIFRLAPVQWADGRKLTAEQVARLLKRAIAPRARDPFRDALGAIEDVVAMTERVIEIRLTAPRPNLLTLLAQPELAIVRDKVGTGPFTIAALDSATGEFRLVRDVTPPGEEESATDTVLLSAAPAADAVSRFAAGKADLVLGGRYADLALARAAKLPRGALRFDPASGLFGLVALARTGPYASAEGRRLLAQAIDREQLVTLLGVPGLLPRATVLEPALDGVPAPVPPPWTATPFGERLPALRAEAERIFAGADKRPVRVRIGDGPGADLLFDLLSRNWGAMGLTIERVSAGPADFALIDEVAPSSSPAWFVRRFRCAIVPVCDPQADELTDAARSALVPAERYALLAQAASRIDEAQLFIPLAAPVRWSLVGPRIRNFAGNRYARHTLTNLELKFGDGG
ncbi:MAG TPA: ABC transporter substrate-binding protein [Sphingomicrobium sp.]|nr:ABC transporter substrate-binding protein [Sphingomicrobium sp.]